MSLLTPLTAQERRFLRQFDELVESIMNRLNCERKAAEDMIIDRFVEKGCISECNELLGMLIRRKMQETKMSIDEEYDFDLIELPADYKYSLN